ncbi:MAG: response regulator [Candidatus Omnitrophica bacterium]|nr:response regulator [Candidatus Omnitrophota bacterium]MDD5672102.1 response regulator [Candidatus Omnitrophota bacterium]
MAHKILIVDDESGLVAELRELLTDFQYDVITAKDGIEGMVRAKKEKPDLIIMDVLMPGMSGFETAEAMKNLAQIDKHVPIIMISGRPSMENYFEGSKAFVFLSKPFNYKELLEAIAEALKQKEAAEHMPPVVADDLGRIAKKVMIIGTEEAVLRKVKQTLQLLGIKADLILDEREVFEKIEGETPGVILAEYCKRVENLNTSAIYRELKKDPVMKEIPFAVLCREEDCLDAQLEMPEAEIITFIENTDLSRKILSFLEAKGRQH